MNKHDYTERPHIDDVWNSFDYRVVMCGMGDDTVMLIAELYERGMEPDELIFCDTGSEFPHTYQFIDKLKEWCSEMGWSKVVVLRKFDKFDQPLSVISLCQAQDTLPAAAFGAKSCSLRFKVETADKYFNNNSDCWNAWGVTGKGKKISSHTGKILRLVGLNADEETRVAGWKSQDKWVQLFPLYDWEIGEAESDAVRNVGLYYPGKSSCTICPHLTHGEIAMLRDDYPVKFKEALAIESAFIEHHRIDDDMILFNEITDEDFSDMTKEQYVAIDFIHEGMTVDHFLENKRIFYPHDRILICNDNEEDHPEPIEYRDYDSKDLLWSLETDGYISIKRKSTTIGLGRGKTWETKLAQYDANPGKYKRMSDTKPCECGR